MNRIIMRKIYLLLVAAFSVMGFSSCELKDELWGKEDLVEANQGKVQLNLANNASVDATTRAEATGGTVKPGVFDAEELNVQNYTLEITDSKNGDQIVKMGSVSELGGNNGLLNLIMQSGQYKARAYNFDGSDVLVSERPFFMGEKEFEIIPGQTTNVALECKLQTIEVGFSLDKSFTESFNDDYSITVDNGNGASQIFTKDNITKKYYFAVPQNKKAITVSVKANTKATETQESQFIQRTYTVTKPADADGDNYLEGGDAFIINLNEDGSSTSYIKLGITVDFSFAEQDEVISIPSENITYNPDTAVDPTPGEGDQDAITFEGLPAEYTDPADKGEQVVVTIHASKGIKNLLVKINSNNEGFMSTLTGFGLAQEFDLANPGDLEGVLSGSLDTQDGIGLLQPGEVIAGKTEYVFDVTTFMSLLKLYGISENIFSIKVVDTDSNEKSGDLKVVITKEN